MRRNPVALARPLVVLAGYHSPMVTASAVARDLALLTEGKAARTISIAYPWEGDIPRSARRAVAQIVAAIPGPSPDLTGECDVVGISMGGLVARLAASERTNQGVPIPRLNMRRLFTIATPHRGAKIALTAAVDRAALDMIPGSAFLSRLDGELPTIPYELVCYGQLRDWWVGATNTAPPGRLPHWTDTRGLFAFVLSHFAVNSNRTILIDIARRLRGEPPIAGTGTVPPID